MITPLDAFGQDWKSESLTGRGVMEYMRDLGLNHEKDVVDYLNKRFQKQTEEDTALPFPKNLKSSLLHGLEVETGTKVRQSMEQAVSNLNGQQLLSKPDQGGTMQTMYVQLPLPWEQGTQTVQMHLKSRSQGEKMDWENCQLFFYLDTPRFGETGISVQVVNREISLRVNNDNESIERSFNLFIPQMEEQLKGLGYKINSVRFEKLTKPESPEEPRSAKDLSVENSPTSHSFKKGLDFTI